MDISHYYGDDLATSATGDLALASAELTGTQRCYRRLLTNPVLKDSAGTIQATGDYLAHQDYGAGVGRKIGDPGNDLELKALISSQMMMEQAVDQKSQPTVQLVSSNGTVSAAIKYINADTSAPQFLSFDVTK